MNRKLALSLSVLGHPGLMPTLCYGIFLYWCPERMHIVPGEEWKVLAFIFVATFALPSLVFYSAYNLGYVKDLYLENRHSRVRPMVMVSVWYTLMSVLLLNRIGGAHLTSILITAIAASSTVASLITFFYKISAHGIGLGGLIGFMLGYSYFMQSSVLLYPLLILLVFAGAVLSARLALNAHNPAQVYLGFLTGASICFFSCSYVLY